MVKEAVKKKVSEMSLAELKALIKKLLREELQHHCCVDEEGYLVFHSEAAYARYVECTGKRPSKVKAYWIDEYGLRYRYSDYQLRPEVERELDRIHKERSISGEKVLKKLRGLGVKV